MRRYYAKANTAFSDEDAKIIGKFLDRNFPNHEYTPEEIVRLASDPRSEVHRYFEWDDTRAAHLYRLSQARRMIGCVVEVIDDVPVPKAVNVTVEVSEGEFGRTYMDTGKARTIPSAWKQVLEEALRSLRAWQERYAKLEQLGPMFKAIDKHIEEIENGKSKKTSQRSKKQKTHRRRSN